MSYEPGTYVKGDESRRADTTKDAVAAVFDGFKLAEAEEGSSKQPDATPTPDEVPEPAPARPQVGTAEQSPSGPRLPF